MGKKLSKRGKDYLSLVYDYILRTLTLRKRMIIADDESGEVLNSVDEILHFELLKKHGKFNEISFDGLVPLDPDERWEWLIKEAEKANNGLLLINVTDIRVFDTRCWCLKQLAKQELPDLRFDGYVLVVVKGISWQDVQDYAEANSKGQFKDMMSQFYRRIE